MELTGVWAEHYSITYTLAWGWHEVRPHTAYTIIQVHTKHNIHMKTFPDVPMYV